MRDSVLACSDTARRSYTLALLMISVGSLAQARQAFVELIARPDFSEDRELEPLVAASLAVVCALLRLGEEAVEWAGRALEVQELPPASKMMATQGLAIGLATSGRAGEAVASLARLSPSSAEPEPFDAELIGTRSSLKAWWGDLEGAAADASAVVTWSRSRAGVPFRTVPIAYGTLAEVEYRLGRWDDGMAHADVAVSLGEENERKLELAYVHAVSSYLYSARGNWDSASEHAESARMAAANAPLPMCFFYAAAATAHLAWVRGEWDAVLQALEMLMNPLERASAGLWPRTVRSMVAEALVFNGRLDDAEAALDGLEEQLDAAPFRDATSIDLWRLRGALAHARRLPDDAEAAFENGRTAAESVQAPLAEALLELELGQFLRRTKRRRAASEALESARSRFAALGAQPFSDRCETELAACGVRWVNRTPDNRYGLTPRENVVARLVASGKTNREVAGELYLSTKAIEYHLGNVFGKVGVHSRRELAARLSAPQADLSEPARA
jgi:ATP/maltotriose-dependent transcriptional regulator MalT